MIITVSYGAFAISFLSNLAVLLVLLFIFGLVELLRPDLFPALVTRPFSIVINEYLDRKYPVFDDDGMRKKIPSCPYVWPNGQGDSAKFLSGIENSRAWGKQHGALYRIWSGMTPEIVLTQPRQLQAVFKDSDRHSKAPANNSGFYMDQLLGKCVGLISGHEWRAVRGVTEKPFQHNAVSFEVESFQRHIVEHFQSLHTQASGCNLDRGLLHPVDDLVMLPFRLVATMFYGRLSPQLSKMLEDLIPLRTRIFNQHVIRGRLNRFAWARFLPTTANSELATFKRAWKEFNKEALAHAQQADGPEASIVAMFAAAANRGISEEQLLQTLDESLFANLDVTIGGLSWIPVFLAAHPNVQQRLQAEVVKADSKNGLRRYLLDGRSTYLACCVLESSRLRPLAAFSVPQAAPTRRRVDVDDTEAGYIIPEGTSFIVDTYALNVRNEAWAPDNEAFRPERFLDGTGKDARDRRYLFWRFGFGPRQCMGKYAADLIIRMTVAHIVRNYRLDLIPGHESAWMRNQDSWITQPNFKLQCVKRKEKEHERHFTH